MKIQPSLHYYNKKNIIYDDLNHRIVNIQYSIEQNYWLVVSTPLKHMCSSVGMMIILNLME
jgi:hypothetical protein